MQIMGSRIYEDMQYGKRGHESYYPLYFTRLIENIINEKLGICLVAGNNKNIVGIFAALRHPALFGRSTRWTEIAWHADPQLTKVTQGRIMVALLREAEKNIKGWLTISVNLDKGIGHYLSKKGYNAHEMVFGREIDGN